MDKGVVKVDDAKKAVPPYASVSGNATKFGRPSTQVAAGLPTITYQNSKRHSCGSTCGFVCTPTPAT